MATNDKQPDGRPSRQWRWTTGRTLAVTAIIVLGGWGAFFALHDALLPEGGKGRPGEASNPQLSTVQQVDPARPVREVHYADRVYQPRGGLERRADGEMVQVGLSRENYVLYAPAAVLTRPGGGGGGWAARSTEPLYLRAQDGRYLAVWPVARQEDNLTLP